MSQTLCLIFCLYFLNPEAGSDRLGDKMAEALTKVKLEKLGAGFNPTTFNKETLNTGKKCLMN